MAVETYSVKPLGDVLRFKNGKSIKPETEGEFPAYGSNGLIGGSPEYREENTIILGRVGAYCGSVAFCPGKFWASDNTIVAYPKDDAFDIRFLSYLLRDLNLNRWAGGAAQPLLTQTVLKQIEAPVPELRVQQKIAAILSAYDDLIENNLRRIKILEEIAQNIYREWFVKFRFPCHAKVRMVDSPLGETPEGWDIVKVGELLEKIKRKNKRVFDLVIDFGTSQSPKSTRPLTTYWCPSRPGHQALRNNFASSLLLRTWLPYDWTPRSEAYFVFPLAQGTPGKQCGLAATGDYQPSLRSPWLAAEDQEARLPTGG